jgi:predicted  nucleic acid-binding Zn-ribbon protein
MDEDEHNVDIDKLSRLQELEIRISELDIVHQGSADADAVHTQREALRAQIDPLVLSRFDRLRAAGLAVAHVRGGMCLSCNLSIPQGDLNRINSGKVEPSCPNCGSFVHVDV